MKTNLRMTYVAALAGISTISPALADLKCGDGRNSTPFQFRSGELVTTWAGPIPQKARVTFVSGEVFDNMSRYTGPDIPNGFPDKYTQDLKKVEIFNQTLTFGIPQLIEVEKHYGFVIDRNDDALPIFEKYAKTNNDFITVLVQLPSVPATASPFSRCSVVLQRGIIEYADGEETLFLRSYFHSENDKGDFVNFVPQGGLKITFPSEEIWFPLSLTKVIQEPASFVVLDILTPKASGKAVEVDRLGTLFHTEGAKKEIEFHGKVVDAIRVTGRLESGNDFEDFRLKLK